ncbi:MAG TPA: dTDP-4-dehydrorhamnose 3,5-epimerase [Verrucomicrobiae bacterium]|nr:dTDP-4-dehydrorhamnose 3,5-epimerase [Verrucomicrobiae bacterium]
MEVTPLPIDGAFAFVPNAYADERGWFKELFAATRYAKAGLEVTFVQDNLSLSHRYVLRGLHGDPRMAKLVQVLRGSAYDVIVDARPASPTFSRWYGGTLRAHEHTQLFIPQGCLHGFLALEDETLLFYKQSAEYDPAMEFGVAWNDPDLAIDWPLGGAVPVLSPKDEANPTLRERGLL